MNLIDDPIDAFLKEITSDADSIAASVDPVRIRTSVSDSKPRRQTVWTGVGFAAAVAALLAIALGVGLGHERSITPATRSTPHFTKVSNVPETVNPFVLTPDPDDPGYACKEGTGESGYGGQLQMTQTIDCFSTSFPIKGEGPLAEGLSDAQIAQDLNWSYVPDPGAPATPAPTLPKTNIPWKWTADPKDSGWECRLWTVESGPAKSPRAVWALECRASVNSPPTVSPLDQGISNAQIAKDLDWASIPADTERVP
jgi:hypothetical protein